MSTGMTYRIETGEAVELPDIIGNLMIGLVWDFRDNDKLLPFEKVKASAEKDVARLRGYEQEALDELHKFEGITDAELEKDQARVRESVATHNTEFVTRQKIILERYRAAEKKLVEWTPPESIVPLKNGMLRHLREQIEYEQRFVDTDRTQSPPMPVAVYREEQRQHLKDSYDRAVEAREKKEKDVAAYLAMRRDLAEELKRIGYRN